MKPFLVGIVLFLGSITIVFAQDFYLPVSSTSKTAITLLKRTVELDTNTLKQADTGNATAGRVATLPQSTHITIYTHENQ
ncbi:hypothetical protein [Spirosoma horti]